MDLSQTTVEERLKAALEHHTQELKDLSCNRGLELATKLIEPNGWQHIAPMWLRLQEDLSYDNQMQLSFENSSTVQRLTAALRHHRQVSQENEVKGLTLALKLVAEDGWKHIAEHWLQLKSKPRSGGVKRPGATAVSTVKPVIKLRSLESLTPAERILCALGDHDTRARYELAQGLKYAIQLLSPEGWKDLAPAWLPPGVEAVNLDFSQRIDALLSTKIPLPHEFKAGLRYALKLVQPDGWELLVPIWLLNSDIPCKKTEGTSLLIA